MKEKIKESTYEFNKDGSGLEEIAVNILNNYIKFNNCLFEPSKEETKIIQSNTKN